LYAGPAPLIVSDFSADQVYPRPVVGRDTYTLFSYDPEYIRPSGASTGPTNRPFTSGSNATRALKKANLVIANVPDIPMNTTRRDEIVGEAYFLRGFFYWMLTKNFGDVVLKTQPSTSEAAAVAAQVPAAQVYEQIYNDLAAAAASLPSGRPAFRRDGPRRKRPWGCTPRRRCTAKTGPWRCRRRRKSSAAAGIP
jgi:hypothetical protein